MSFTADQGGKNYVLGRGRLYFDRFDQNVVVNADTKGQGELYFGNTPELSLSFESEDLEHFSSEAGVNVKDASVQLSATRSGSFTTDNISADNVALFFLGEASSVTQTAATAATDVITVIPGRFYQIGTTAMNPPGVRNISNVVITTGTGTPTTITQDGNYDVDQETGRLYILPESTAITASTEITVTYDIAASTRDRIISGSKAINGALRFVAENATGPNRDYYFPYVKLSPDGDYALKGDDWQTIGFTLEVLEKSSNVKGVYIDGRASTL